MTEWQREFYPVFDRDGLIIDVRHNNGGNIDSWILEKLLRKAWFFWQPRVGNPTWNMQYAFRGHVVVPGGSEHRVGWRSVRRRIPPAGAREGDRHAYLGRRDLAHRQSNVLVDRGIATAAETGVFGPEGDWLIEGHGVDPDIVVDNLPHAHSGARTHSWRRRFDICRRKSGPSRFRCPSRPSIRTSRSRGRQGRAAGAPPARGQFIEQEPGPRGSPHDPQGPRGCCVAPEAGPEVRAANTDWRFSSSVPWQDGHAGVAAPRVSHSNR